MQYINITVVISEEKSKYKHKINKNTTFCTEVLKQIRQGKTDYVFHQHQIDELLRRLEPHEKLVCKNAEGYIIVSLEEEI